MVIDYHFEHNPVYKEHAKFSKENLALLPDEGYLTEKDGIIFKVIDDEDEEVKEKEENKDENTHFYEDQNKLKNPVDDY